MRCSWWTTSLLILAAAGLPAAAQSPADRAALAALRDSLATMSDQTAVAAVPLRWSAARAPGMEKLREGLIDLREAQLTGRPGDFQTAILRFDDATHDAPAWPWPLFGRGLAKLHVGELGTVPPKALGGQLEGEAYYEAFQRDAVAALARDPEFAPLVAFVIPALDAQLDRAQPAAFITALERAGRSAGTDPRAHLIVARARRLAGDDAGALRELDAYAAAGGDAGVGALERARALAGDGQLAASVAAYRRGAARMDSLSREIYRDDLSWIATPEELASFDSLGTAPAGEWLERFWSLRAAESLRLVDERIGEHLRRWAYANRHFRVVHPERRTQFQQVRVLDIGPCSPAGEKALDYYALARPDRPDDFRRKERVLDDRAPIYLRHGAPVRQLSTLGSPLSRGESSADLAADEGSSIGEADRQESVFGGAVWLYWFAGKPRVYYFAGSDALGHFGPTTLFTQPPLSPELFNQLAGLDPAYGKAAGRLEINALMPSRSQPLLCQTAIGDVYRLARADVGAAIHSDSYTLQFDRQLAPVVQTFAVGQPARGTGRLVVSVAVPGERLVPEPGAAGHVVSYTLSFRVSAVDSVAGIVRTVDSTRHFTASDPLRKGQYLTSLFDLALPAGTYTARVAVFQAGTGAGGATLRPGAHLTDTMPHLSDIILGTEHGGMRWDNGGDPVEINVLGAYPSGGAATVYYEAYGLEPGRRYRTAITLRKAKGRSGRDVSLVFDERAAERSLRVRRTIELGALAVGQYTLAVTLKDTVTGRETTSDQLVNIVAP